MELLLTLIRDLDVPPAARAEINIFPLKRADAATMALGAAFPLALAAASGGADTVGRDAARVYAFNTMGAIAGALTAGFVLLPLRGHRSHSTQCATSRSAQLTAIPAQSVL